MARPRPTTLRAQLSRLKEERRRWLFALRFVAWKEQQCEIWAARGEPMPPEVLKKLLEPVDLGPLWPPPRRWQ